ncbi:MAG: 4Fe-4S dicluster domain-containing protein [Candidatus Heimdallarchaeota archaeon]
MQQQMVLMVDLEKCTGCRICEMACSFHHYKIFNPTKSMIRIVKLEEVGIDVPIVCGHCLTAPCAEVCPTGAIQRDAKTGAVLISEEICIGCKVCMVACPFWAIAVDLENGVLVKCDLCEGDPECIKLCPREAIIYRVPDRTIMIKKREVAEKLSLPAAKMIRGA